MAGKVQGGRAGVEDDALAVVDQRGGGGADARLLAGLQPLADVEGELRPLASGAIAPPWVRTTRPLASSASRSLRIVTAETPNCSARSATRARPCSSTMRAMLILALACEDVAGLSVECARLGSLPCIGRDRRGFDCGTLVGAFTHMSRRILKPIETYGNLHPLAMARALGGPRGIVRTTRRPPATAHSWPTSSGSTTMSPPAGRWPSMTPARRRRASEPGPSHRCGIKIAADRAAVVGVRQLGHPVQGVRPAGRAARPVREDRRRRPGAPLHRRGPDAWPCTSRGTGSTTTPTWPSTPPTLGVRARHDQLQRLPGRRLHARQRVTNPDPRVRRKAIDHLLECVDIMDATGSRDLKLWFSDGTNYPGQDDIRGPAGPARRGAGRGVRPARATTSGCCWSTSCSSRPSTRWTCRTGAPPTRTASRSGRRPRSCVDTGHHAPGTNIEFIVALLLRAGKLGGVRLQLPLLRRRRPDGRRRRPVPAVPDHVRGRPRRRARRRSAGVAFMLDQCHNIEPKIPGQIRSVMNVQEATAKALLVDADGARGGAAGRRRARRQRGAHGRLQHRRAAAARRAARGAWASTPTRWRRTRARATPSGSSPSGSAASRPAGAHEPSMHDDRARRSTELIARSQPARAPTRATPTTPAATPRPRARRPTRSPASPSSCSGSRAPAATSAR